MLIEGALSGQPKAIPVTSTGALIIAPSIGTTLTGTYTSTPAVVDMRTYPRSINVVVIPGSGNVSRVEYTITADPTTGSPNWISWSFGDVNAAKGAQMQNVSGLRFTRVSGSSTDTYEVRV